MANSKSSGNFYEYATVDTAPIGLGFFTNQVNPREHKQIRKEGRLYFSIREEDADSSAQSDTSDIQVTLQFRCEGDAGWQDYQPLDGSAIATGNRLILEDSGNGVHWRAGVLDGDHQGGSVTFGFDW